MQTFDFANQLILVTGAAQGIGAAVVRSLVQAGAQVAGLDIQPDKLDALGAALGPQRFNAFQIDISRSLEVNQAIEQGDLLFFTAAQGRTDTALTHQAWQPFVTGLIANYNLDADHGQMLTGGCLQTVAHAIAAHFANSIG